MTALSEGYIYFIESEALQQNWLTNPHNIDLDNFTEGLHYCKIELPTRDQTGGVTGISIIDSGAGTSYDDRTNRYSYSGQNNGLITSRANVWLVDQFIMNSRHTAASPDTYMDYYMIKKYDTADANDSYEPFMDDTGTQRRYCKGAILNWHRTWMQSAPNYFSLFINFKSCWGT